MGVEVIEEEAKRRDLPDTPVRFFSIIPDQVLHQLGIEGIQVVNAIDIVVNELVLDGPVEPFQVAVRLRMSGVIEEVNEAILLAKLIEVLMELAAVIGLDSHGREWGNGDELIEEVAAVG